MAKPLILSTSNEQFTDRKEAGKLLADALSVYRGKSPVVLGIPRGGLVIAAQIASGLGGDIDIIVSRKLRTPGYPELAMGSVSESGQMFLNENITSSMVASAADIEKEKKYQVNEIKRRLEFIRKDIPKIPLAGRLVIVTDDGVATGATFQTALITGRTENPAKLIGALPVGAKTSLIKLSNLADELLCLRAPELFAAVGQFYKDFEPVTDAEVLEILKRNRQA